MSTRWLTITVFVGSMGVTAMAVSAAAPLGPLQARTTLGVPIDALGNTADSVLILVYDPADVFTCSSAIQEWRLGDLSRNLRVRLVYSRPPTEIEGRQLRAERLDASATVRPSLLRRAIRSGEYLFVHGQLVQSSLAPAIGIRSPLFALTQTSSVADSLP